jgi:hypothetical protein
MTQEREQNESQRRREMSDEDFAVWRQPLLPKRFEGQGLPDVQEKSHP